MNEILSVFFSSGYPVEAEGAELLKINSETVESGLALTKAQALELARTHRRAFIFLGTR